MNARRIPRTTFTASLSALRTPFDVLAGALPGRSGRYAKLSVERADVAARDLVGRITFDGELRQDASRRRAALRERYRAASLRDQAGRVTGAAEDHLEERHEQAQRRRRQADSRATTRRRRAGEERQTRVRQAETAADQRLEASEQAEVIREAQIDEQAPRERLEAVQAQAQADREQERALAEADEARRLGEAAAALKAERKEEAAETAQADPTR